MGAVVYRERRAWVLGLNWNDFPVHDSDPRSFQGIGGAILSERTENSPVSVSDGGFSLVNPGIDLLGERKPELG